MEQLVAANEKQVKASTLPILRFSSGNMQDNQRIIHFDLRNGGTGPAIIEWLRLKWDKQPAHGPRHLLDRCCGTSSANSAMSLYVDMASGQTLPAGHVQSVFSVSAAKTPPDLWDRLNLDARFKIEAEACYCSPGSPTPGLPDCAAFAQAGMAVIPLLDRWGGQPPSAVDQKKKPRGRLATAQQEGPR
jgi:hypothetical protein